MHDLFSITYHRHKSDARFLSNLFSRLDILTTYLGSIYVLGEVPLNNTLNNKCNNFFS